MVSLISARVYAPADRNAGPLPHDEDDHDETKTDILVAVFVLALLGLSIGIWAGSLLN